MNIIIDKNIPFISGIFEPFANVTYLKGEEFTNITIKDADALIIRTRTKCNRELLQNTSVKFIATATIGTDHIDMDYCLKAGIKVENAAGCNAGGVMQYVFTALYALAVKKGFELPCGEGTEGDKKIICREKNYKKVLGVIGVGNVGSKIAELGELLGFEVLRCDPLKERDQTVAFNSGLIKLEDFKDYYSLEYLLENSDIVTMHTWLDTTTKGMANSSFFEKMKQGAIFINASRGEVVVDDALIQNIHKLDALVIDVWNGEPSINKQLLSKADIATPHIAGYSYEGKMNGTTMAVNAVARFFGTSRLEKFAVTPEEPNNNYITFRGVDKDEISKQLTGIFPIFDDDYNLRCNPDNFEKLRSNYKYRREFYVNSTTDTTNC